VDKYFIIPRSFVFENEAKSLIKKKIAIPIAGDYMAFINFEIKYNQKNLKDEKFIYSVADINSWKNSYIPKEKILESLNIYNYKPKKFMGLSNKNIHIMGIVNVTSDSFSNQSSKIISTSEAVNKALKMYEEGASIIDIGGESSRPGAMRLDEQEEQKRVIPVIKQLSKYNIPISCDTRNSSTMQIALDVGAKIINDISSLSDKKAAGIIAKNKAGVILMHMKGQPNNMQKNPKYNNVSIEVLKFLKEKKQYAIQEGIEEKNILIDPGIGFGKNDNHNLKIFRDLPLFHSLRSHILVGASRKSMIGRLTNTNMPERLPGSLSLAIASIEKGVKFIRVHDVKETKQALMMWNKIYCN
jgi:dihydropteroate synthase